MKRGTVLGMMAATVLVGCAAHHEAEPSALTTAPDTRPAVSVDAGASSTVVGTPEAASPTPDAATGSFTMIEGCGETLCQKDADDLKEQCKNCYAEAAAAAGDEDFELLDSECNDICEAPPTCAAEYQGICWQDTFTANVTTPADPNVQAACVAALTHTAQCAGTTPDTSSCDAVARSMVPAMTAAFNCEALADCSTPASCPMPPASTLGDQLCAKVAVACGYTQTWFDCSDAARERWNQVGGGFTADATNAALSCFTTQNGCVDAEACLKAWDQATGVGLLSGS